MLTRAVLRRTIPASICFCLANVGLAVGGIVECIIETKRGLAGHPHSLPRRGWGDPVDAQLEIGVVLVESAELWTVVEPTRVARVWKRIRLSPRGARLGACSSLALLRTVRHPKLFPDSVSSPSRHLDQRVFLVRHHGRQPGIYRQAPPLTLIRLLLDSRPRWKLQLSIGSCEQHPEFTSDQCCPKSTPN